MKIVTMTNDIMKNAVSKRSRWIYFLLGSELYAIPLEKALELVILPEIVKISNTPKHILGLAKLKDDTFPVVDLRVKFGLKSIEEDQSELVQLLQDRKQDHIDWLEALKDAIYNGVPFSKTLDPDKCAFGKWYNSYKSNLIYIAAQLRKFDKPHRMIHKIGALALQLQADQKGDEAKQLITGSLSSDLSLLIKLFDNTSEIIKNQTSNIAIIARLEYGICGFLVDKLESVVSFEPTEISEKPIFLGKNSDADILIGSARKEQLSDKLFLLMDPDKILSINEINQLNTNYSKLTA